MKIILKWSKKEHDWEFHYPDNAGRSIRGVFFSMLRVEENISWIKNELVNGVPTPKKNPQTLKEMLTERGYDYKTLKITCKKIKSDEDIQ
jgi:hypothetical protein